MEETEKKSVRGSSIDEDLLYAEGNSLFEEGKFKEAIEIYSKIIEGKSEKSVSEKVYLVVLKNRGLAYYMLGKFRKAKRDFSRIIELCPRESDSFKNRAFSYLGLKKFNKSILDLTRAIEIDPNDFEAYRNRGLAYFNCQNYDIALENFSKAIDLNPVYVEAYNNRGVTHGVMRRYDLALADFSKAIGSKPNCTNALENRGLVLKKLGRFEDSFLDLLLSSRIKKFEEKTKFKFKQSLFHSLESSLSNWETSKTKNPHFLNVFKKLNESWKTIMCEECEIILSDPRTHGNLSFASIKSTSEITRKEILDLRNEKRNEFLDRVVQTIHNTLLSGVYSLEEIKKELSRSLEFFRVFFDSTLFQVVSSNENKNIDVAEVKVIGGFSPLTLQSEGKGVEYVDCGRGGSKKKFSGILGMKDRILRKIYFGDFKNGKREGIGSVYSTTLTKIHGSQKSSSVMFNTSPQEQSTKSIDKKGYFSRIEFHGEFKNNKKEGKGIEYCFLPKYDQFQPIHVFEGLFRNGIRHGRGEEFDPKSGRVRRGYWENGKFDDGNNRKSGSSGDTGIIDSSSSSSSPPSSYNNIVYDCPIVSYDMIEKYLQSSQIVGSGAFGVIYMLKTSLIPSLRNIQNRKYVAVKIMKVSSLKELMILFQVTRRGIGLCQTFTSPHVLEIYAIIRGCREVGYVTGLCEKSVDQIIRDEKSRKEFDSYRLTPPPTTKAKTSGENESSPISVSSPPRRTSTESKMKRKSNGPTLDMNEKIRILYETSLGMKALHSNLIMHRDMKWSNVMRDFDGVIKITDFDTLKEDEIQWRMNRAVLQSSRIGTPGFLAPEVFKGRKYTLKCDVYAYGLMIYSLLWEVCLPFISLYQCVCGNSMNSILRSNSLDYHVANCNLRPLLHHLEVKKFPPFLISLMRQCWDKNPFNRPSFDDIVNFFENSISSEQEKSVIDEKNDREEISFVMIKFRFPKYERFLKDQDMILTKPLRFSRIKEWVRKKFDTLGLTTNFENIINEQKKEEEEEEEEETEGEEIEICDDKNSVMFMIKVLGISHSIRGSICCDEDFFELVKLQKENDNNGGASITLDIEIEESEMLKQKLSLSIGDDDDYFKKKNRNPSEQDEELDEKKKTIHHHHKVQEVNSYFYEEYQKIRMEKEKMKKENEEIKNKYEEEIMKLKNVIKDLMKSITERELKKDNLFEL